jgi:hypothetical protein
MINILGALELAECTRAEVDLELPQSAPPINQSFCCYELLSIDVVENIKMSTDKPAALIGQSNPLYLAV